MKSGLKIAIAVLIVLLIAGAGFYTLTTLNYFNVAAVDLKIVGPVKNATPEVARIIQKIKGQNILMVNLEDVKTQIMKADGIKKVSARRWYPDRLIIDITYSDYYVKVNADNKYYVCDAEALNEVDRDTYMSFSEVKEMKISDEYCAFLSKWGYDEGFFHAIDLLHNLDGSLISNIKYDNNNGNGFGRLVLDLNFLDVQLYINELVSPERVQETINVLKSMIRVPEGKVIYDLYSKSLIKRT